MPDACPRCTWLKLKAGHALPWQIFPGIFSSIDSYTKQSVAAYHQEHQRLPACFQSIGREAELITAPHHSRFQRTDAITGITLRGMPDEILRFPDGSCGIVDYKTGRYTDGQDRLLPMYQVQLNAYAWIAKVHDIHPIRSLSLIYFEPVSGIEEDVWPSHLKDEGFSLDFQGQAVRLPLDPDGIIPPLLHQARWYHAQERPPASRQGCQDCERLQRLIDLVPV